MMVMHRQVVLCDHEQADHEGIFDVISHHAKGVTAWHVCSYLHAYMANHREQIEDMYGHEFERGEVTFGEYLDGLADSVHPEKGDLLAAVLLACALGIHIAIIVKGGHFVNTKASNAKGDMPLFTACVQGHLVDTKRVKVTFKPPSKKSPLPVIASPESTKSSRRMTPAAAAGSAKQTATDEHVYEEDTDDEQPTVESNMVCCVRTTFASTLEM